MRLDQNIDYRKADKILRNNGYKLDGCRGSHYHYRKEGCKLVVVNKGINPTVWQRLCKENNLVIR